MADLAALLQALDTSNQQAQRAAGHQLLAAGPAALPGLVAVVQSGAAQARKAAAFLLGSFPADEARIALETALVHDSEPKVRKNAAIALGQIKSAVSVPALAAALAREPLAWVRVSLLLALGAIGGDHATTVLAGFTPSETEEQAAWRKALDHSQPKLAPVAWREATHEPLITLLETPIGLEGIALHEATSYGLTGLTRLAPGLLACPPEVRPWQLTAVRSAYGPLLVAAEGPPIAFDQSSTAAQAIADLCAHSPLLQSWRDWLITSEPTLAYRFELHGVQIERSALRQLLDHVRTGCTPLGLVDSPSRYAIELRVVIETTITRILVKPTFVPDLRFAYRQQDVGAAINPVVGAGLIRLIRPTSAATVFDPTCGSGTLLIEWGLADPQARLVGLDVSATALRATSQNAAAAGLAARLTAHKGNAQAAEAWPACDVVLANLPFGLRTARADADLGALYRAIIAHTATKLAPNGQAMFCTTNKRVFEASLQTQSSHLRVINTRRVWSGGLWLHVWLLGRN